MLLHKNWLLKLRAPIGALLEICLPFAFVLLMLWLKGLFHTDVVGAALHLDSDFERIPPFFTIPTGLKLAGSGSIIAVASSSVSGAKAASRFFSDAGSLYPATNLSLLGGGALVAAASALNPKDGDLLRSVSLPGFAEVATLFGSEDEITAYVTAKDYGTNSKPPIYAAIVFSQDLPQLTYTLRFNNTELPSPYPFVFTYAPIYLGATQYLQFSPPAPGQYGASSATSSLSPTLPTPSSQGYTPRLPSFLTLQLTVDRWAINSTAAPDPVAVLSPPALVEALGDVARLALGFGASDFGVALEMACLALAATNATALAAVGADLARGAFRAESYAPQRVDLAPFPSRGYTQNIFYSGVLGALTLIFVLAYTYPVSRLVSALVYEKETRMRESMLTMGLSDSALYGSWFLTYAGSYTLLSGAIAVVGVKLFPASSPAVIFALFLSFSLSTISLCLLVAVFFTQSKVGSILGTVAYLGAYFVFYSIKTTTPLATRLAAALLSPTALAMGIQTLAQLETNGVGATTTTAYTLAVNSWTLSATIYMQFFDTILYLVLAYYFDKVLPASLRDFGTPLPFYFPCMPSFWGCRCGAASGRRGGGLFAASSDGAADSSTPLIGGSAASSATAATATHHHQPHDASRFEARDSAMAAKEEAGRCVSLRQLRKEFDTPDGVKVAVAGVDMTLYEGEIFVLLGHNGAGKTTTLSMLTGLLPPTSGTARVFGAELGSDLRAIRGDLGVCPQHDVLWPELTVREHLAIFAALKGVPVGEVEAASSEALAQVGLTEKAGAAVSGLSGGQKRKLSVCLAFLGGSRVVLLDEPTSGMDPYSRRSTWQILQSAREGRVILLTTHFMDEADILGDRVAVMAAGSVECSGSPAFLKAAYGLGYTLTVVLAKEAWEGSSRGSLAVERLLQLVRAHIPSAVLVSQAGGEVKVRLPVEASEKGASASASSASTYPALLRDLEAQRDLVASLGMHMTSIEDIFMKIATDGHEGAKGASGSSSSSSSEVVKGRPALAAFAATGGEASERPAPPAAAATTTSTTSGSGSVGVGSVRALGRRELSPWSAFTLHLGAIFQKRARYARRDFRAVCCLLLVPVAALTAGLSLLLSGSLASTLDFQLSTAQFRSRSFLAGGGTAPTLLPALAFLPGMYNASSGAFPPAGTTSSSNDPGIAAFLSSFQTRNVSFGGGGDPLPPVTTTAPNTESLYRPEVRRR